MITNCKHWADCVKAGGAWCNEKCEVYIAEKLKGGTMKVDSTLLTALSELMEEHGLTLDSFDVTGKTLRVVFNEVKDEYDCDCCKCSK